MMRNTNPQKTNIVLTDQGETAACISETGLAPFHFALALVLHAPHQVKLFSFLSFSSS